MSYYNNPYGFGYPEDSASNSWQSLDDLEGSIDPQLFAALSDPMVLNWSGVIDPRLLDTSAAPTENTHTHEHGQEAYPPGFGDVAADEFPLGNPFSLDANIRGGPSDQGTSGLQTAHVQPPSRSTAGDTRSHRGDENDAASPAFGETQDDASDFPPVQKAPAKKRSTRRRTGKRLARTQVTASSSQLTRSAPVLASKLLGEAESSSRALSTPSAREEPGPSPSGASCDAHLSIPPRLRLILPRGVPPAPQPQAGPEQRRSGRKRATPPTYPMDAAPPPQKKRKQGTHIVTEREASGSGFAQDQGAVAGPSGHGMGQGASTAEEDEHEETEAEHKRDRRTLDLVHKDMLLDLEPKACSINGCTQLWDPYGYHANQAHLHEHVAHEVLASGEKISCIFEGCEEMVSAKRLLLHIGKEHVGLPYLCPIRCGWATARPGYQAQHMRTAHKLVWKSTTPE